MTKAVSNSFESRKRKILVDLAIPDAHYTDLSPKGSVDEGVRALCNEINSVEGYVTTSSCAGRIAVYLDGPGKDRDGTVEASSATEAPAGGKGGGKWLYISHDPVDVASVEAQGSLLTMFGLRNTTPSVPGDASPSRLVYLKFEPMILHILTSSSANAQRAYAAAYNSGFRESGIWSITGSEPTPYIAVRTQGLALQSVIGYVDSDDGIKPMVSEDYLRSLLHIANQRFVANSERKERFRAALLQSDTQHTLHDWEPASTRSARKREEGLRRREELKGQKLKEAMQSTASRCNGTTTPENVMDLGA